MKTSEESIEDTHFEHTYTKKQVSNLNVSSVAWLHNNLNALFSAGHENAKMSIVLSIIILFWHDLTWLSTDLLPQLFMYWIGTIS